MSADATRSDPWWPFGAPSAIGQGNVGGPGAGLPSLVCFPFAGGGASTYRPWRRATEGRLEICPLQLPGREARFREAAHTRLAPLLEQLMSEVAPRLVPPFAFFGYSMGALIATGFIQRLAAAGGALPRTLVVAAARPPHCMPSTGELHSLPDEQFITALGEMNGTPAEVLAHRELMELVLPTIRADFALCETYRHQPAPRLEIPLLVFGGDADPNVTPAHLEAWREVTSADCEIVLLPGDHFFFEAHQGRMLELIRDRIS
ncbi:MAG: thioesterase [Candidatus Eisenbacteria bacterium]|nr:thioesterase [Candidatus Eisenbacteria bacterium]